MDYSLCAPEGGPGEKGRPAHSKGVDSLPLSHLGSLETLQEWEFQQRSGLRARIQEDKQETRVCPPIPPLHLLCNLGQTARPLQGNGEGLDHVSLGQLLIEGPNPAQKIKSSNK